MGIRSSFLTEFKVKNEDPRFLPFAFAVALSKGRRKVEDCPPLNNPDFEMQRQALVKLLG